MTTTLDVLHDHCPTWCIEESTRDGRLRVPASQHGNQHSSSLLSPGQNDYVTGGRIFLSIKSVNLHGEVRAAVSDADREPWIEISIDDDDPEITVTAGKARSLARLLVHLADEIEGLHR